MLLLLFFSSSSLSSSLSSSFAFSFSPSSPPSTAPFLFLNPNLAY